MKPKFYLAIVLFLTFVFLNVSPLKAQVYHSGDPVTEGVTIYSLPSTALILTVDAEREVYTPGPYAKFAQKYLGITVPQEAKDSYQLLSIKLTPYLEADPSQRYIMNLAEVRNPQAATGLLKFTSQGLVLLLDQEKGQGSYWSFPTLVDKLAINSKEATQNFTSTETTLYKNVKNSEGGYEKVAIQQSQVVEKSPEKKAQEVADLIFKLRQKRIDIITGDTDATFSGEALGAAIKEINRLEEDFMSLFLGKTETASQSMVFTVIPKADAPRQLYIAFRFSPTLGILSPTTLTGRPIVLELTPESPKTTNDKEEVSKKKTSEPDPKKNPLIYYRVPSVCQLKVLDGEELLLQSRMPIYQLGEILSFPVKMLK